MKKVISIFVVTIIIFYICGFIAILKRKGFDISLEMVVNIYYEITIYAIKSGTIIVVFDWIYRNMFPEEFNKSKKRKNLIESFFVNKLTKGNLVEEVLSYILINNWDWYIYEINAIDNGKSPVDLNMLNKELDGLVEGYHISWEELKELLTSLVEIKSCLIVALKQKENYQDVAKDDFVDFLCLIRIKDGSSCEIKLNRSLIEEEHNSDQI